MAHQVLALRLAFQPVNPDNPTVQAGPEEIVERGGLVPDYVSPFIISTLSNAGLVTPVADPELEVVIVEPVAPALPNPEQPPTPDVGPIVMAPAVTTKPKVTDSKDAWEAYAASPAVGMDRGEAEAMSKVKLIAEVNRIEQERATPPAPVE